MAGAGPRAPRFPYSESDRQADGRIFNPVCLRNNPPMVARLAHILDGQDGTVLEIGAGTGQHAAALNIGRGRNNHGGVVIFFAVDFKQQGHIHHHHSFAAPGHLVQEITLCLAHHRMDDAFQPA